MKNKTIATISIIALIVSIIALMNPHIESKFVDKEVLMEVNDYHDQFSTQISYKFLRNADIYSMVFDCSEGITLTNNFDELCHITNDTYYCPTVPTWETRGVGFCLIKYKDKVNNLEWN